MTNVHAYGKHCYELGTNTIVILFHHLVKTTAIEELVLKCGPFYMKTDFPLIRLSFYYTFFKIITFHWITKSKK